MEKSLSELLGSGSSTGLFAGTPFQPPKPSPQVVEPVKKPSTRPEKPSKADKPDDEADRIVFVGNVSLESKKKTVKKLMSQYGEVEKVWRRSIPLDRGKIPIVAAVALKQYKAGSDACNFYVLFKNPEDAKSSLVLNGQDFLGKHLRVDLAANPNKNNERTVFVGNLPFSIKEDELWEEFKEFGELEYVRVIKDPHTFQGKGIAYICFKEKKASKRAIAKNNVEFQGRRIRVSKAREKGDIPSDSTKKYSGKETKKFGQFGDKTGYRTNSEIFDQAPINQPKHPSSLKGTKKLVRKEQIKLQAKRQQHKASNTTQMKKSKKKQKTSE